MFSPRLDWDCGFWEKHHSSEVPRLRWEISVFAVFCISLIFFLVFCNYHPHTTPQNGLAAWGNQRVRTELGFEGKLEFGGDKAFCLPESPLYLTGHSPPRGYNLLYSNLLPQFVVIWERFYMTRGIHEFYLHFRVQVLIFQWFPVGLLLLLHGMPMPSLCTLRLCPL